MRVSIVLPYYGHLPKWFPLFLESAGRNRQVHFIIVTDEIIGVPLPQNVTHVPMPLVEIERRVKDAISPEFRLSYGYKLCDLKPFYGIVFEDLVRDSDFWGYCDLDLVFGDLSPLFQSGCLNEADMYYADAGPVVGTFCLFRNIARMNNFARQLPGYIPRLCSREYLSLDEIELDKLLQDSPGVRCLKSASLAQSQLSISTDGRMVGRTSGVFGDPSEFYWSDGHTFIRSPGGQPQEVMYLHFIGLKRPYHWSLYDPSAEYNEFGFSAAGFQPWRTPPTTAAAIRLRCRQFMLRSLGWCRAQIAMRLSTSRRHQLKSWLRRLRR